MPERRRRDIEEFLEGGASPILGSEAASLGPVAPGPTPRFEGQRLGPWQLREEIGHGGMSVVYRAARVDGEFEQEAAIKVLRQPGRHPELARRFRVERQILAGLVHPHIARILDGGVSPDGWPWIAMELVDGQPLDEYLRGRSRVAVLERFGQVCDAVHHAHQHLVVHRDLKPSNILVDPSGTVKLLDFGIAKLLDRSAISSTHTVPLTSTGMRLLTPEYAAPEQLRGQAVTTQTDVYALGMILYQLVAGRRPYELGGVGAAELERLVCEQDPPPPASGNGELDTICMKALRKEPGERYATARELQEDLERLAAGKPIRARPTTVGYRLRKFVRRNRLGVAAGGLVVLLSVAFGVAMGVQARATAQARDVARLEAERAGAVSEFLVGVFEAGNPRVAGADTVGARELLEEGVLRLDHMEGQPELQAQMLDVMARAFHALGQYGRSAALAQRALELHRAGGWDDPVGRARLERRLGAALLGEGRTTEGLSILEAALATLTAELGGDHEETAYAATTLGEALVPLGQPGRADSLLTSSVRTLERVLGPDHPSTLSALDNLCELQVERGEYERAIAVQETVLARRRRVLGPGHLDVASSLNDLAVYYRRAGHDARAEEMYRASIDIKRQVHDGAHPDIALGLLNLGIALGVQGKYDESEVALLEALAMRRELLGEAHPQVASSYSNLAMLMVRSDQHARAVEYGEASLRVARASGEPPRLDEISWWSNLSLSYDATGRHDDALRAARESVALARELLPAGHPRASTALAALAQAQLSRGELGPALEAAREAHEILVAARGERQRAVAISAGRLGEIHRARGELEQAARYSGLALELRRELSGDDHPRTADALHEWGLLCLARGDREGARAAFEEALAIREARLGAGAAATGDSRDQLARLGEP